MDHQELKELLPLYVANTLTPEERAAVDDAVNISKELADELAFWRKAHLAAQSHATYQRASHLSSEQIVDYAERAITDLQLRSAIESHLQACTDCREEYDMIMQTIPKQETRRQITSSMIEKIQGFITSFKPVYVLPVVAVLIGVVVLWRGFETKSLDENTARFVIPFQGEMRATNESPSLTISESVKRVQLVLCIPHDSLVATRYTATLTTPAGATIALSETFSKITAQLNDSLKVNLSSELLRVEGEYTLNLAEIPSSLPPGASPFPPEPYRFKVTYDPAK